uniref:LisH domain-containing protein n=1 Tax=Ditylenchus dipsaci TaxID=166011 RepID=A0A915E6I4_9BILA
MDTCLAKHISKFQAIVNELINDPLQNSKTMECDTVPELSVHAQYILEECLVKIKNVLRDMLQEHRLVHPPISKCGKDLDRNFQSDLNGLMKNEKNIETNPDHLQKANKLIFEHLMSLGRVDVAETFMEESELAFEVPPKYDMQLVKNIMEPFRAKNFLPAINWVEQNAPKKRICYFASTVST